MKNSLTLRLLYLLAWQVLAPNIHAQTTLESLLEEPVTDIAAYDTAVCKDCIFLKVEYGSSEFLNLDVLKKFDGKVITQVEMFYTSFARTKGFDQVALNRERLSHLQTVAPQLFENKDIVWKMTRQTACSSLEESERLFHGFVVHLAPGSATRDKGGKLVPVETSAKPSKPAKTAPSTRDTVITEMQVRMEKLMERDCEVTGKYLPRSKAKAKKGVRYDSKTAMIFWKRKPEKKCKTLDLGYRYDTTYHKRTYKVNTVTGKVIDRSFYADRRNDTIVTDVMSRNWKDWKTEKTIVVQDVTGSMSSYLLQILKWHETYAAQGVERYVFFNDGDNKPASKKEIGKTGGIYYTHSKRLSEIQDAAYRATNAGHGGDTPENNIEALLYAQERCSDCTLLVMIADNYAPVKDMVLLKKVKKPLRIIVCGGNGETVHSDYLTIAAVTGGSVHTSKLDLHLKGAAEKGEVLKVGERTYAFKNGRYELVKE